jgi:membrane protein required for beta-lactamase induction
MRSCRSLYKRGQHKTPSLLTQSCTCSWCLQAAQEKAARAMEAKLDRQRKEQEAAAMLLTERDAAVLGQQQDLQERLW